jgi:hypothetical protein
MIKDNQLSLFEKLNDPMYTKKLSQSLDEKLSSKKFWEEDEKIYLELPKAKKKASPFMAG